MKLISTFLLFTLLAGCVARQPGGADKQIWLLKLTGGIQGDFELPISLKEITPEHSEIFFPLNQKLGLSGLSEGDISASVKGKIINGELKADIFGSSCFEIAGFCGSLSGSMIGTIAAEEGSGHLEMTAKVREVKNITYYNFVGTWSLQKSSRRHLLNPETSSQEDLAK